MIMEPDKQNTPPEDKISGAFGKAAYAAAIAELLIYWWLVIRFPAVMIIVSVMLCAVALFFPPLGKLP